VELDTWMSSQMLMYQLVNDDDDDNNDKRVEDMSVEWRQLSRSDEYWVIWDDVVQSGVWNCSQYEATTWLWRIVRRKKRRKRERRKVTEELLTYEQQEKQEEKFYIVVSFEKKHEKGIE